MAVTFSGLDGAVSALTEMARRADRAAERAVAESAAVVERQAKINASGRPGPEVRTGAHRRSFVTVGPTSIGPGRYQCLVGPTMVYSRALELGHPRWPAGVKYPSLGPAMEFAQRVAIPAIFRKHWQDVIGG